MLFARSVRRNICYGLEAEDCVPADQVPSAEDVERAARLANAHDFIAAMPQGYDTVRGTGRLASLRMHARPSYLPLGVLAAHICAIATRDCCPFACVRMLGMGSGAPTLVT